MHHGELTLSESLFQRCSTILGEESNMSRLRLILGTGEVGRGTNLSTEKPVSEGLRSGLVDDVIPVVLLSRTQCYELLDTFLSKAGCVEVDTALM